MNLIVLVTLFSVVVGYKSPLRQSNNLRRNSVLFATTNENDLPVVIIGSGISGLSCAKTLKDKVNTVVLEKSNSIGGRIQTDSYNGYLLDRGFQIFINSYPLVQNNAIIDQNDLDLQSFNPGALIYWNKQFHRVSDPLRRPSELFDTLLSPIGSFSDKIKIGIYSLSSRVQSLEAIQQDEDISTMNYLTNTLGLSDSMVNRFFKPFYQGIFLSAIEEQSSRMFQFVFKMLALGSGCLPKKGMGVITQQVASSLPPNSVKCDMKVVKITQNKDNSPSKYTVYAQSSINQDDTIEYHTNHVVLATDAPSSKILLTDLQATSNNLKLNLNYLNTVTNRSSTCFYYGFTGNPPVTDPVLVLNGSNDLSTSNSGKPSVNNVCFPSQISSDYAPIGKSLASVTVIGYNEQIPDDELNKLVKQQLSEWWGKSVVDSWELLRIYRIKYAQPAQKVPYAYGASTCTLAPGLYTCGDHIGTATLNGAIDSGIRVAQEILSKNV